LKAFWLPAALSSLLVSGLARAAGPDAGVPATATPAPAATPAEPSATAARHGTVEEVKLQPEPEPRTLESWIPPVSGQSFTTGGRVELAPGLGFSLNDPFIEKVLIDFGVGYHFSDAAYLGLQLQYAYNNASGLIDSCKSTSGGVTCTSPTTGQLLQLPGKISLTALAEGGWSPIYGKVNIFGEKVLHFDFSLLLGLGAVFPGGPADHLGFVPVGSKVAPAVAPGIGTHIFLSDLCALTIDFKSLLYWLNPGGFQNQLMLDFGLSFFIPSSQNTKD